MEQVSSKLLYWINFFAVLHQDLFLYCVGRTGRLRPDAFGVPSASGGCVGIY
jgi:hypothetical protein